MILDNSYNLKRGFVTVIFLSYFLEKVSDCLVLFGSEKVHRFKCNLETIQGRFLG